MGDLLGSTGHGVGKLQRRLSLEEDKAAVLDNRSQKWPHKRMLLSTTGQGHRGQDS
jgi:hypothetical protein